MRSVKSYFTGSQALLVFVNSITGSLKVHKKSVDFFYSLYYNLDGFILSYCKFFSSKLNNLLFPYNKFFTFTNDKDSLCLYLLTYPSYR